MIFIPDYQSVHIITILYGEFELRRSHLQAKLSMRVSFLSRCINMYEKWNRYGGFTSHILNQ